MRRAITVIAIVAGCLAFSFLGIVVRSPYPPVSISLCTACLLVSLSCYLYLLGTVTRRTKSKRGCQTTDLSSTSNP